MNQTNKLANISCKVVGKNKLTNIMTICVVNSFGKVIFIVNPADEASGIAAEQKARGANFVGIRNTEVDSELKDNLSVGVFEVNIKVGFVSGGTPIKDKEGNIIGAVGVVTAPHLLNKLDKRNKLTKKKGKTLDKIYSTDQDISDKIAKDIEKFL